jgi:pyridoxamine 5'-phosphate oxidase
MQNIAELRKEYSKAELDLHSVDKDPIVQFQKWFNEAVQSEVLEPNAMLLSTISAEGKPSGRIVLLKGLEGDKFQFYTNYQSRKGKELDANPACALTFFWPELERQVRIEGVASRVSSQQSDDYFQSRPRASQLGAWSSPQSSPIRDRSLLEERMRQLEKKFEGVDPLPRPHQWGGYEVSASLIEYWQGRPYRLHDRIQYVMTGDSWSVQRLAP